MENPLASQEGSAPWSLLVGWLVGWLAGWLVRSFVVWLVGWRFVDWFVGLVD